MCWMLIGLWRSSCPSPCAIYELQVLSQCFGTPSPHATCHLWSEGALPWLVRAPVHLCSGIYCRILKQTRTSFPRFAVTSVKFFLPKSEIWRSTRSQFSLVENTNVNIVVTSFQEMITSKTTLSPIIWMIAFSMNVTFVGNLSEGNLTWFATAKLLRLVRYVWLNFAH